MKTRKISISSQLFLFILGAAIIVAMIVGVVAYGTMENFLRKQSREDVLELAEIAAQNVDGETFLQAVEGNEEALSKVKDSLSFFLAGESVTYVYTLMPKDETHFQFVVDTDPDDPGEYGEDYEAQYAMFEAMMGNPSVTQEAFTDEWGTFYSGYAPISYGGIVLGMVAVDYDASSIQDSLNSLVLNIFIAVAVGLVFAVLAAFAVSARIKRNFVKVNDKINEVVSSEGDLTKVLDITSGDELEVIGGNLNQLLQKTGNTVRGVKSGTGDIESKMREINTHVSGSASRITDISDTVQTIVASAQEIAASLEVAGEQVDFVYSDIEDIVDIVTNNTNHLRKINISSKELNDTAKRSSEKIMESTKAMSLNLQEEKEKADAVLKIKELSDMILNISGQTNLLALNASIEAARAGEAGRGFSVVATEIGALAGSTNDAANEIQKMSDDVVQAIGSLHNLADRMLELLRQDISGDYVKFADISQNFTEQSENIQKSMEQLQGKTVQYAKSLEEIKDAILSVGAASKESSTEIVNVSGVLASMDIDMKNIDTTTEETFSAISAMNHDLDSYRV